MLLIYFALERLIHKHSDIIVKHLILNWMCKWWLLIMTVRPATAAMLTKYSSKLWFDFVVLVFIAFELLIYWKCIVCTWLEVNIIRVLYVYCMYACKTNHCAILNTLKFNNTFLCEYICLCASNNVCVYLLCIINFFLLYLSFSVALSLIVCLSVFNSEKTGTKMHYGRIHL